MSVRRSMAPARLSRGSLLGLGVALSIMGGLPNLAFAGSGSTEGGTIGNAESHGSRFTKSEFDAGTISQASERRKDISAVTVSEGQAETVGLSRRGVSHAKVRTYASASASKNKKTLAARAVAGVAVAASAEDGSGKALVLSSSGSLAYAQSGKTLSAYALSGTGASALAEADGKKVYTTASILDGTTSTFQYRELSYSIAYTNTGSFAMAMSNRKSVSAMTGTTTNAGALASGNLSAFLGSSTLAAAFASPGMASAYAEAMGFGAADGNFGSSSAFSFSWASAMVTSGDDEEKALTSSGSKDCKSVQWLQQVKITDRCNIEF